MITTKMGACLENGPARNKSGFNLSGRQWWVTIIKCRGDMYIPILLLKK